MYTHIYYLGEVLSSISTIILLATTTIGIYLIHQDIGS